MNFYDTTEEEDDYAEELQRERHEALHVHLVREMHASARLLLPTRRPQQHP